MRQCRPLRTPWPARRPRRRCRRRKKCPCVCRGEAVDDMKGREEGVTGLTAPKLTPTHDRQKEPSERLWLRRQMQLCSWCPSTTNGQAYTPINFLPTPGDQPPRARPKGQTHRIGSQHPYALADTTASATTISDLPHSMEESTCGRTASTSREPTASARWSRHPLLAALRASPYLPCCAGGPRRDGHGSRPQVRTTSIAAPQWAQESALRQGAPSPPTRPPPQRRTGVNRGHQPWNAWVPRRR